MNQVYGSMFSVARAKPRRRKSRKHAPKMLKDQFILDAHTHFIRDDPAPFVADAKRIGGLMWQRKLSDRTGWNPDMKGKEQTVEDLKFDNYFKEIYLDSDTKVALLAQRAVRRSRGLDPDQRDGVRTRETGQRARPARGGCWRTSPSRPANRAGWTSVDNAIEVLQARWLEGLHGRRQHAQGAAGAWRLDDEKLMYPAYEKAAKAGIKNVCVHKGLFPAIAEALPHLRALRRGRRRRQGGQGLAAAQLRHLSFGATAMSAGTRARRWRSGTDRAQFLGQRHGRDPGKYGVTNVYGDLGRSSPRTDRQPRLAAALMGTLVKGLGADHVIWGTDAVWTGSPQWQIEGLRRLEIPEDMQTKHGFAPLGPPTARSRTPSWAKTAGAFLRPSARRGWSPDRFTLMKAEYDRQGGARSNLRYGYVHKPT